MKKRLDWKRIVASLMWSIVVFIVTTPVAIYIFGIGDTITLTGTCLYTGIMSLISIPIAMLIRNREFFYHNGEDKQ